MAIAKPVSSSVELGLEESMIDNMTAGRRTPFEFASEPHLGTDISDERTTLLAHELDETEVEDFSSLPWWKRPSVSAAYTMKFAHLRSLYADCEFTRCYGCCLRFFRLPLRLEELPYQRSISCSH